MLVTPEDQAPHPFEDRFNFQLSRKTGWNHTGPKTDVTSDRRLCGITTGPTPVFGETKTNNGSENLSKTDFDVAASWKTDRSQNRFSKSNFEPVVLGFLYPRIVTAPTPDCQNLQSHP